MKRALSLSLVLATLLPGIARADAAEEARFHDERARAHYSAGRYEQAIREFFLENRLAPNPRVLFNIALCFDELHEEQDAYLYFQEYLAGDDDDASRHERATRAISRLEPLVARVALTSEPAGATIYVDQREHGSYGRTPRTVVLEPGEHTIFFDHEGHRSASATITAVRGESIAAAITLERIVGSLAIRSSAPGTLRVEDASGAPIHEGEIADAPVTITLPEGTFEVIVEASGHEPARASTRVTADTTTTLALAPAPLPVRTGELAITASAAGALIEIDGEPSGFAPAILPAVPVGTHRVRVSHAGLESWQGEVVVAQESRAWLTVTLVPPSEVTRSPLTWIVGGAGVASLIVGGVLGGLALSAHDAFDTLEAQQSSFAMGTSTTRPTGSLLQLHDEQSAFATGADIGLAIGGAALGVALVLYFATESTEARHSEAVFAEGDR